MSTEFQNAFSWMSLPAMILAAVIWLPIYDKVILPRVSTHLLRSSGRMAVLSIGPLMALMIVLNIGLAALIAGGAS